MNKRDYNQELKDTADHKYAYNFDIDIMHPFMLRSFKPYFQNDNVLELGSHKGEFTKRLIPYFNNITCVEASDNAIKEAKNQLTDKVIFYNDIFEKVSLPKLYDNIIIEFTWFLLSVYHHLIFFIHFLVCLHCSYPKSDI